MPSIKSVFLKLSTKGPLVGEGVDHLKMCRVKMKFTWHRLVRLDLLGRKTEQ